MEYRLKLFIMDEQKVKKLRELSKFELLGIIFRKDAVEAELRKKISELYRIIEELQSKILSDDG